MIDNPYLDYLWEEIEEYYVIYPNCWSQAMKLTIVL
jgi:hypothetical protein